MSKKQEKSKGATIEPCAWCGNERAKYKVVRRKTTLFRLCRECALGDN